LSKIFDRVVLKRLLNHTELQSVLPDQQLGFRAHHSTCHQVSRIVKDIKIGFQSKFSTGMLLLDIEKAYDMVWHVGLIYKMSPNYPLFLLKIVKSFLTGRTFALHYRGLQSRVHDIPAGLPQGAALSPTLYNIFTSDSPDLDACQNAIFADETAIYSTHSNAQILVQNLQNDIDKLQELFIICLDIFEPRNFIIWLKLISLKI
jgi:hypothetical protein